MACLISGTVAIRTGRRRRFDLKKKEGITEYVVVKVGSARLAVCSHNAEWITLAVTSRWTRHRGTAQGLLPSSDGIILAGLFGPVNPQNAKNPKKLSLHYIAESTPLHGAPSAGLVAVAFGAIFSLTWRRSVVYVNLQML